MVKKSEHNPQIFKAQTPLLVIISEYLTTLEISHFLIALMFHTATHTRQTHFRQPMNLIHGRTVNFPYEVHSILIRTIVMQQCVHVGPQDGFRNSIFSLARLLLNPPQKVEPRCSSEG